MTEDEHKLFDLEFRLVDTDGSGTIDWWEFLNFQAKSKIASRDQVCFKVDFNNKTTLTYINRKFIILN